MCEVIAIAIPKGGVGKTTTAVNLAASLAVAEKRTLLIDMDTFGASSLSLGFTLGNIKYGLSDVFNFVTDLKGAIHKTDLAFLDVVPCNVQSLHAEERMLKIAENRSMLRTTIQSIRQKYDFVILDCPPLLRGLTTNALIAADSVLIPVRSGHVVLDAVDRLFRYLQWLAEATRREARIEGILVTMHEPNTKVTDITLRELQSKYGHHIFESVIPRSTLLSESSFYGKPAILYNAKSRGTTAYLALAREILARQSARSVSSTPDSSSQLSGLSS